jgi:hypothetical protein
VYLAARRIYGEKVRYHHNFEHVLRDLFRALVIAEDEEAVDYGVLIPSVLLHDIGFSDPDFRRLGHDVAGARLAQGLLVRIGGYGDDTVRDICHCIRAHKAKAETPRTLEARILYDADVLEKAGLLYLIFGGKMMSELEIPMADFIKGESADRAAEVARGFYTRKARELDGGKLKEVLSLLSKVKKEITNERPDFGIREQDLWVNVPEGPSD